MGVEDEFTLEAFLPYRLAQTAEAVSLEFYRHYRACYAMTRPEWRVMAHLGEYGPLTARDICERAQLHKTKVSRAVASLERRRWLKRRDDAADRRFEWLALTASGRRTHRELCAEGARLEARLRARLGGDGAVQLLALLERLKDKGGSR